MIQILPEHKLTVTFSNNTDENHITTFVNIISKCTKEANKKGFKNMFTHEESDVIKALNETLKGNV